MALTRKHISVVKPAWTRQKKSWLTLLWKSFWGFSDENQDIQGNIYKLGQPFSWNMNISGQKGTQGIWKWSFKAPRVTDASKQKHFSHIIPLENTENWALKSTKLPCTCWTEETTRTIGCRKRKVKYNCILLDGKSFTLLWSKHISVTAQWGAWIFDCWANWLQLGASFSQNILVTSRLTVSSSGHSAVKQSLLWCSSH